MTNLRPEAVSLKGGVLVFKTTATGSRRVVTQRDDDLLTPTEVKEQWPAVEAAMLKELLTWAKLKCFSRKARRLARNIIDARWVLKWKVEQPAGESNAKNVVRTIRARLTVRGFKDQERNTVDRYSGTSACSSQKLLVSEAVLRGWDICTADISKAFLQGVTYEELSELTGEPIREVNFWLPPSNIPLLQKVPGFENFDPTKEVLRCDKPGTGLVDAPRAFNMKLKLVVINELGFAVPKWSPIGLCV